MSNIWNTNYPFWYPFTDLVDDTSSQFRFSIGLYIDDSNSDTCKYFAVCSLQSCISLHASNKYMYVIRHTSYVMRHTSYLIHVQVTR